MQISAGRRRFLRGGALATVGATLGGLGILARTALAKDKSANLPPHTPGWMQQLGRAVGAVPYGQPSEHESGVIRRQIAGLTTTDHSSVSFTPLQDLHGTITPNGLVFERHHGGVPTIAPEEHRLMIHGLVDRPLVLTVDELMRFPAVSRIRFLECSANSVTEWAGAVQDSVQFTHGMLSCCEWTGVPLSTLLKEAGIRSQATWILAEGADAPAMTRSLPIEYAMDDVLVVYAQNGERLRPEQGYPLRLLVPGLEGNLSIKWLRRIEVGDGPWMTREETSKYTDLMPNGKARQFTLVQEANSVITFPSAGARLAHKGFYEIRGLAWSGRGRIKAVDVSFDGGGNWQTAELESPVRPKSLTRFRIPWRWQGQAAVLQSRAVDETGYVQPTHRQLVEARGTHSIYHNNGIQSWRVRSTGEVTNVDV